MSTHWIKLRGEGGTTSDMLKSYARENHVVMTEVKHYYSFEIIPWAKIHKSFAHWHVAMDDENMILIHNAATNVTVMLTLGREYEEE
tara:strand:- start:6391 stop:6651 length:261 start_codon:yes stop_codon:yes gene_type:complete